MTERLLQFIWQLQYYNSTALTTLEGETLQIIHPGIYNTNQGPDFSDAKIKIGNTLWAGSIELHINAADWQNHHHSSDKNYNNVILHVVWQQDIDLKLPFQTLVLEDKVSKLLLKKYDTLMKEGGFIPCEKIIHKTAALTWISWKERLLVERLQQKSQTVLDYLKQNNNHWEESFWWMLSKNLGATVNSIAFEKIAQSIPLIILAKHKHQIHQTEALLFGQSGLLQGDFTENYPKLLKKEYQFLKNKYKLKKVEAPLYFLRMRPANFPSVRLAQMAMLVHSGLHLLATIKNTQSVNEIKKLLKVTANDYWHYHYVFEEPAAFKKKVLGGQMIDTILINTVVVILFTYGVYHNESKYKDRALQWLEQIAAEKNNITKGFLQLGIDCKMAFDSQALIQLKNNYCSKKRCLECAIGNQLLKE